MDQKGFKTRIGGQAVIEGIAMKGSDKTCLAVRLPDGSIHTELFDTPRPKGMNIPILRGPIAMIHSLIDGMKYINLSAAYAFPEDENKDTKEGKAAPADGAPVPERAEPAPEADGNTPAEQPAEKKPAKSDTALTVISGLLGLALAVLLFMYLPTLITKLVNDRLIDLGGWKTLTESLIKLAIFLGYLFFVTRMKEIHRVFEYHGAEHKTIFCYENGCELTPANAQKFRRFHPRCGTSFLFIVLLISILAASLMPWGNVWLRALLKLLTLPVTMGISYEIIQYCGRHDNLLCRILSAPGLWVQRLTTFEPDESQLEVAIAALKAVMPDEPGEAAW